MAVGSSLEEHQEVSASGLSDRTIFKFFLPLALSWIFMSIESPLSVALISRLPDAAVSTAGFQIMMALALLVESPVIDLLSTSTTLARSKQNYVELSRFVWWLIGAVTVAHAVFVFSPLYWFVTKNIMHAADPVAREARLGLAVMIPWSGFIGWRRYLQGILIRNGRTKLVGIGTAVRVVTMFGTALLLYFVAHLPSIQIAGIGLICAVGAEAAFAHWASRQTVRERFSEDSVEAEPITQRKLRSFHLPLTMTTIVTMLSTPAISTALDYSPDSVSQLAGYQIALTLVWFMRTTVYALPEVVITLYRDRSSAESLRRFCLKVGCVSSGAMLLLWVSGADKLFFRNVLGAKAELVPIAHMAFIAPILAPLIGAMQSYVRGMLTAHHLTVSRLLAVGVAMGALLTSLLLSVLLHVNNVIAAGICMTIGLLAELVVLTTFWRSAERRNELLAAQV